MNNLSNVRDSARISQMQDIYNWLIWYSLNKRLPLPTNNIDIIDGSKLLWYQWELSDNLLTTIEFSWLWVDTKTWEYYTVLMNKNRNKFQILWYLENEYEDESSDIVSFINTSYADWIYDYPFSAWNKLGIIMDDQNRVIHSNKSIQNLWEFNISTQNIPVKIQYSNDTTFQWNIQDMKYYSVTLQGWGVQYSSCLEIKNALKSAANYNGEYIIQIWSQEQLLVECNMTDNWGGWTRYAEIIDEFNFSLAEECYNSDDIIQTDGFYCFNPHRKMVDANDLMVQVNQDYASANSWDQYIQNVTSDYVGLSPVQDSWKTRSCSPNNNYFTPMDRAWSSYDGVVDYYRLWYSFCNGSRQPGWVNRSNIMNFSNSWKWPNSWNGITKARNTTVVPFTFYYR